MKVKSIPLPNRALLCSVQGRIPAQAWRSWEAEGAHRVAYGLYVEDRPAAILLGSQRAGEARCHAIEVIEGPADVATYMLVRAFVGALVGPATCWFEIGLAHQDVDAALGVLGAQRSVTSADGRVLLRLDMPALTRINPSLTPPPDAPDGEPPTVPA